MKNQLPMVTLEENQKETAPFLGKKQIKNQYFQSKKVEKIDKNNYKSLKSLNLKMGFGPFFFGEEC